MKRPAFDLEILTLQMDTVLNGTLGSLLWGGGEWVCVKKSKMEIWLLDRYILIETAYLPTKLIFLCGHTSKLYFSVLLDFVS